jgi:hypothetical protein
LLLLLLFLDFLLHAFLSLMPQLMLLQIVVENQGRVCFGDGIYDRKGIFDDVTLDGKSLTGWTIAPVKLDPIADALKSLVGNPAPVPEALRRMSLWKGTFSGPCSDPSGRDTFLGVPGWTKGVAWVNGFNLAATGPSSARSRPSTSPRRWSRATARRTRWCCWNRTTPPAWGSLGR